MEIVFVDNHLLVVSKPAGLATQPHSQSPDNLTDCAKAWIKQKYHKPGKVFLEPIHRLDRPVSGLVLFARTSKALSRLQEMMRNRQMTKTYYARVEPLPDAVHGVLEHHLMHDEFRARVVPASHPEGKRARLSYQLLESGIVEIDLETGRYHQIRAQFSAIGCPILGDVKYGSTQRWKGEGIALHHGKLQLIHPVTKESLILHAPWL